MPRSSTEDTDQVSSDREIDIGELPCTRASLGPYIAHRLMGLRPPQAPTNLPQPPLSLQWRSVPMFPKPSPQLPDIGSAALTKDEPALNKYIEKEKHTCRPAKIFGSKKKALTHDNTGRGPYRSKVQSRDQRHPPSGLEAALAKKQPQGRRLSTSAASSGCEGFSYVQKGGQSQQLNPYTPSFPLGTTSVQELYTCTWHTVLFSRMSCVLFLPEKQRTDVWAIPLTSYCPKWAQIETLDKTINKQSR